MKIIRSAPEIFAPLHRTAPGAPGSRSSRARTERKEAVLAGRRTRPPKMRSCHVEGRVLDCSPDHHDDAMRTARKWWEPFSRRTQRPISAGRPSSSMLPTYIEAITPRKRLGCSVSRRGPAVSRGSSGRRKAWRWRLLRGSQRQEGMKRRVEAHCWPPPERQPPRSLPGRTPRVIGELLLGRRRP